MASTLMRPIFRILGMFALLFLLGSTMHAQSERIRDFHSDIHLLDDGTLVVKETIAVFSTGNQIRHGIYREFPTRYKDRLGNNYVVGFHLSGALRDEQPEPSRVEDYSNGKRIYLGDKNIFVPTGEHTYELSYTTNRQLGFFKDHDELFWNVTGNGWGFPIDHASATVSLPFAIAQSEVSLDGFTGPQGSYEKNLRSTAQPDGQFEFEALRPLRAKEGLSIVLSWKKGLIAPPTTRETLDYFFTDNRDALVMVAGLLLLLIYYANRVVRGRPRSSSRRDHAVIRATRESFARGDAVSHPHGIRQQSFRRGDSGYGRARLLENKTAGGFLHVIPNQIR